MPRGSDSQTPATFQLMQGRDNAASLLSLLKQRLHQGQPLESLADEKVLHNDARAAEETLMRIQTVSLLLALIVCCHVGDVFAGIISGNSVTAETTIQLGTQVEHRGFSESTGPQGDFDHLTAYSADASLSLDDGLSGGTATALATAKANHLGVYVDLALNSSLKIVNDQPVAYNAYGSAFATSEWQDHVFVSFQNPLLPFSENSALEMIVEIHGNAFDIGNVYGNPDGEYVKNEIVEVRAYAYEKVYLETLDDGSWYPVEFTEDDDGLDYGWEYEVKYTNSIPSHGRLTVRPAAPASTFGLLGINTRLSADVKIILEAGLKGESVGSSDGHPGTNSNRTTLDFSHTLSILGFRFYGANGDMMDPDLFQVTSQTGYIYDSLGPEVSAVPEPGSLTLVGLGALGMAAGWRRRRASLAAGE
ncbi:MAG: PEP-CTERM sorting domain-containing protein [Planctomycetaceae bacterium]